MTSGIQKKYAAVMESDIGETHVNQEAFNVQSVELRESDVGSSEYSTGPSCTSRKLELEGLKLSLKEAISAEIKP